MAFPRKLYAVPSQVTRPQKHNVVEIQTNKLREFQTKKAVDRANTILDRLEKRVAHFDEQIQRIHKQYLKPLEQRRALAQQRMERLEDEILDRLSDANLDRVDGFRREFQAVPCPKAVQVDNLGLIPAEFVRHKPEADKVAIKRALERDRDLVIPGVHLTQTVRLARK